MVRDKYYYNITRYFSFIITTSISNSTKFILWSVSHFSNIAFQHNFYYIPTKTKSYTCSRFHSNLFNPSLLQQYFHCPIRDAYTELSPYISLQWITLDSLFLIIYIIQHLNLFKTTSNGIYTHLEDSSSVLLYRCSSTSLSWYSFLSSATGSVTITDYQPELVHCHGQFHGDCYDCVWHANHACQDKDRPIRILQFELVWRYSFINAEYARCVVYTSGASHDAITCSMQPHKACQLHFSGWKLSASKSAIRTCFKTILLRRGRCKECYVYMSCFIRILSTRNMDGVLCIHALRHVHHMDRVVLN